MPPPQLVIRIDVPSRVECVVFSTAPVLDPTLIAVACDGSVPGDRDAARLFDAMLRTVGRLNPSAGGGVPCAGTPGAPMLPHPTGRSVLVQVGDGHQLLANPAAWHATSGGSAIVLPVLPAGAALAPVLGPALATVTALQHQHGATTVIPDILRAARVGGADFRVFISYRRDDTQALAAQLFSTFATAGFRVFLDVSTGTPARRFPDELAEELADKGLILVLASPRLPGSHWTRHELAFARSHRLGAVVLDLPGGRLPFRLPHAAHVAIHDGDRVTPHGGPWQQTDTLSAPASVLEQVRNAYAPQVLLRRLYLENAVHAALSPHGLRAAVDARRVHHCHATSGAPRYAAFLSSRPPGLAEVRRVTEARATASRAGVHVRGLVIGPGRSSPLLRLEEASDVRWLAGGTSVRLWPEGQLRHLASLIALRQA